MANKVLDTSLIYAGYDEHIEKINDGLYELSFYIRIANKEPKIIKHQDADKYGSTSYEELNWQLHNTEEGPDSKVVIYGTKAKCTFLLNLTKETEISEPKHLALLIIDTMLKTGLQPENMKR